MFIIEIILTQHSQVDLPVKEMGNHEHIEKIDDNDKGRIKCHYQQSGLSRRRDNSEYLQADQIIER
jgi:hypothetical protein